MIVLDTHVLVWWVSDPRNLSDEARAAIREALDEQAIYVSSMSIWEMALLIKRGRLELSLELDDWIAHCEGLAFLTFVPVTNRIAIRSVRLPPPLHSDPVDRLVIATAHVLGATLVTKDDKILSYPHIHAIW